MKENAWSRISLARNISAWWTKNTHVTERTVRKNGCRNQYWKNTKWVYGRFFQLSIVVKVRYQVMFHKYSPSGLSVRATIQQFWRDIPVHKHTKQYIELVVETISRMAMHNQINEWEQHHFNTIGNILLANVHHCSLMPWFLALTLS